MKNSFLYLLLLLALLCVASSVLAMPPHPDLLARIRNHEIPEPYYLKHLPEIRAKGVDAPSPIRTIDVLRQRALDEDINIIAILVDFTDHPSQVQPVFFDSLLYGHHTNTLNDYYQQVSYGNLTLVTVDLPSSIGWQRMPQTYAYYVDNQNGQGAYPQNAQRLTEDAVHQVDSLVDFSQYDNNGDGHVDALFIIHSGRGAEFTGHSTDIWSHAWSTRTPQYMDGVIVDRYSMEPEYWQSLNDMTCGVFAHEMGHAVFGLPDLYDYGYDSEGLGTWTIMAAGSWNGQNGNRPAQPDAWSRIQMGFAEPVNVVSNLANVSFPQVESAPVIYRLWANGTQGSEYYLVENRQQVGYDLALRGNGMLIYHVDDTQNGNDNQWYPGHENGGHYQVALEQSDGQFDLEHNSNAGDSDDPYPSWNDRYFTNGTLPSSRSYSGAVTRVTVRNISASADTMTADLAVRAGAGNLVFVQLPDTNVVRQDTVYIPITIDTVTGQNITSVHFTLTCDSSIAEVTAPYFDRVGAQIPQSWTVTETHSLGTVSIFASGTTPLAEGGLLLRLRLRVLPGANEDVVSPLTLSPFAFNQGEPEADITSGSLTVSAAHILSQPGSVSFGNVGVGRTLTRTVILRNNGTAALEVESVSIAAPFTTDFSGPVVVLPSHWAPLQVTFAPDSTRLFRDSLLIVSNASEGDVRVPVTGQGVILSADNSPGALPTEFSLAPNAPNPFNSSTVLRYDVPRRVQLSITVYDVTGRKVDEPVSGTVEPGHYSFNWSCSSCGSGVYLFVMSTGNTHFVQKAMLIK